MTRQEIYNWLDGQDWDDKRDHEMASVYFMVTANGYQEPLYFMHYEDSYFESLCTLYKCEMTEEELKEYVRFQYEEELYDTMFEYEMGMYRDGVHYEIENFQRAPWLEEIDDIKMISEQECLDWLIEHEK